MLEDMNDCISVIMMSEAENVYWLHTTYQPKPFYSPLHHHHWWPVSEARVDRMRL